MTCQAFPFKKKTLFLFTLLSDMNLLMTSSYLFICAVVSVASAFPGHRLQLTTFQQKKAYCASLAMKTVMADLTLPVAQSNFRQIPMDTSAESEISAYDSPLNWDILEKLKAISETNWLSTLKLGETTSKYAKMVLKDFYKVRETCLIQMTESGHNQDDKTLGENDFIDRLSSLRASEFRDEKLSGSPDDRMFKRGDRLSLNPSGWRKRRDTISDSYNGGDRNDEEFLRNMRQLYEKRRRRLQFNPTGW